MMMMMVVVVMEMMKGLHTSGSRHLEQTTMSRIRGVVANYLASQARDPGIDSHQHLKIHDIYMAPSEE